MKAIILRVAVCSLLIYGFAGAGVSIAHAEAYYNVTDIGGYSGRPTHFLLTTTGNSLSIRRLAPMPSQCPAQHLRFQTGHRLEWKNLPEVYGVQGAELPIYQWFPMEPLATNDSGVLIGGLPNGESRAFPYSTLTLGYTQKLSDGQYTSFHPLISNDVGNLMLNALNQILITGSGGNKLVDISKGTTTDITSLLSPSALSQYSYIRAYAISDNGTIFAMHFPAAI